MLSLFVDYFLQVVVLIVLFVVGYAVVRCCVLRGGFWPPFV